MAAAKKTKQKEKEQEKKKARPKARIWVMMGLVIFGELFVYTWSRTECFNKGYVIAEALRKKQTLESMITKLTIEESRLSSMQRISRIAEKELGLNIPEQNQIIMMDR